MATLTVGPGEQYSTISAAVAAASSGDTIDVDAGTYTNDFPTISQSLTLQAVGGTVYMVATVEPPNGKGIIDEGGSGVNVTINGFDISGAQVPDNNGSGIRYEGGSLTLNNDSIHNNQDGLLSAPDPNGTIAINGSTFTDNGAGDGESHNIYIGDIASFTLQNSTSSSANVGHEVKSRAENNTITNNLIQDGPSGNSSYEIDFPNGGNDLVANNVIEKGPDAQNPIAITFGEEGNVHANSSLTVQGNTILNNDPASDTIAVVNDTATTANISGNNFFGWPVIASGPADVSGNTVSGATPTLAGLNGSTQASSSAPTSASSSAPEADPPSDPPSDPAAVPASGSGTAFPNTASLAATMPVTAATVGSASATPTFLAGDGSDAGTQGASAGASASPAVSATSAGDQQAANLAQTPATPADLAAGASDPAVAMISPASSGPASGQALGAGMVAHASGEVLTMFDVPSTGSTVPSLFPT